MSKTVPSKLQEHPRWRLWREYEGIVWESILDYVNAHDTSAYTDSFGYMVGVCMGWIDRGCVFADVVAVCADAKAGANLELLGEHYRYELRCALTWLSAPERYPGLAVRAGEFLQLHLTDIRMEFRGLTYYDSVSSDAPLLSEWPTHYRSVMSPVCRFLKDMIDCHDLRGEKLRVRSVSTTLRQVAGEFSV